MKKLIEAAFYAGLFTLYGGSFYFLFGLLMTLSSGGETSKFIGDFIVGCIVAFVGFTFIMYEIQGMFEELNKPRKRDDDKDSKGSGDDCSNGPK